MSNKISPVFYHEDHFRMKELIPEENYFVSGKYIEELPKINQSEFGFYSINIINEQPILLSEKNILYPDIKKLLDPIALSFFDYVESGFGRTTYVRENTVVWGFEFFGIFVEYLGNKVQHIYICSSPNFDLKDGKSTGYNLVTALNKLGLEYNLILIDWNMELIVKLSFIKSTKKYVMEVLNLDC